MIYEIIETSFPIPADNGANDSCNRRHICQCRWTMQARGRDDYDVELKLTTKLDVEKRRFGMDWVEAFQWVSFLKSIINQTSQGRTLSTKMVTFSPLNICPISPFSRIWYISQWPRAKYSRGIRTVLLPTSVCASWAMAVGLRRRQKSCFSSHLSTSLRYRPHVLLFYLVAYAV